MLGDTLNSIPLYGYTTVDLFTCCWTLELFPLSTVVNRAALSIHVQVCV